MEDYRMNEESRPDPDALLARVEAEERQKARRNLLRVCMRRFSKKIKNRCAMLEDL